MVMVMDMDREGIRVKDRTGEDRARQDRQGKARHGKARQDRAGLTW
jgi:hypothetical protein